ncbi:hypothetical protein SAMN05216359_12044 [Roseateles sp. YR242]|uniref:di-heme-cytochrome C peroxidase n=1 Tax=Roseateles sp. YR242 TaxID=1855305 RepID=UPI0008AB9BAB|nr:di-heme-cytochrome C peroxidase [Roseateles sp. YR242]SEL86464.1 hypothetical protein SAMN05216359_12044 [Roseateles sp. YR242]
MSSRRRALVAALIVLIPAITGVSGQPPAEIEVVADQGWTEAQRQTWYGISQGSRLIPLDWLQALEQADSAQAFLSPEHVQKFRFLPSASTAASAPLPLGFALDAQSDEWLGVTKLRWRKGQGDRAAWVGMNCAACHTGELVYQNLRLRIEGAPALSDFQGFLNALNRSLDTTRSDAEKWSRFSARVLGATPDDESKALLADAFSKFQAWQTQVEKANHASLQYGFARVDAFGHIYNKVLLRVKANDQPFNPSDAPVSYPFLWNIHQQDRVQWNGSAPNVPVSPTLDIGALARNVGEVTGVFADVTVLPVGPAVLGYPTSANVDSLLTIERQVAQLKPPVWPTQFPPIDVDKWEAGKKLFHTACARCHIEDLRRDDLTRRFKVTMTRLSGPEAIGTDPWMACNAYTYSGNTGKLQFTAKKFFPVSWLYGEKAPVSDLLGTVVIGSIWNRGREVISDLDTQLKKVNAFDMKQVPADVLPLTTKALSQTLVFGDQAKSLSADKASRLKFCITKNSELLAYKGRPLLGIWATAPYLHNGSVPTLYDLLLPPANRPTRFSLGTREFDPQKVGYVNEHSEAPYLTEQAKVDNTFVFKVSDDSGVPIAGNSNLGHDYGNAMFSDADRWALVEYMKAANAVKVGGKVVP